VPVPGIENVVATHADSALQYPQRGAPGIRFYRAQDKSAAAFTAAIVAKILEGAPPRLQDLTSRGAGTKPGLVEVWLPCGPSVCR
jgi:hypothetical protein